jgi:tetratricopeptide (TPR) repeat protein
MSFKASVCPACQRDIQIPSDIPNPSCPYCGAAVGQEGAAPAATISTLMGMAKTAQTAGNSAEALSYFNRVLESDPTNSEAWIGKGKAAGWQTTLGNLRVSEMLVAFNHAVATANPEETESTLQAVTHEANHLIVTIYKMARDHMLEFVSLPNSWPTYVQQMGQMVDALSTVSAWNPTDRITLENIVHLCKDNIEGVSYRDQFNNNAPHAWTLTPEYESLLRRKLDEATNKLRGIDPAYAPPQIEKKKAEDCFVITATMGDPGHPDVKLLQSFRDDWLQQRAWGSLLICWYYRHGPSAAAFIAQTDTRRRISHRCIVRPAVWLVRRLTTPR